MSFRRSMEQLRPAPQSKINIQEKIQYLLTEGKGAATKMEGVIAACINNHNLSGQTYENAMLKDPIVKEFITSKDVGEFGRGVFNRRDKKAKVLAFRKFGNVLNKVTKVQSADAGFGQSKPSISKPWTDVTGKSNDTSKADILVGNFKTSVKGPLAQLMSGEKKEAKATILAACESAGVGNKLRKDLLGLVDQFVENTKTIGADVTSGALKKMSVADVKKLDKELLKQKKIDTLKDGNAKVKKILDNQTKTKMAIQESFAKAFGDKKLGPAFAIEAMTGYEKFGGKSYPKEPAGDPMGEATHMLVWDYGMTRAKFFKITNAYASKAAKQMSIKPDLKSNSYQGIVNGKKQKLGYSFYQAMRVSVEQKFGKEMEDITESYFDSVYEQKILLSEGVINENILTDKLSDLWNNVKEKFVQAWNWLLAKIQQIRDFVVEAIFGSIPEALNAFETDVDVGGNYNAYVKL